MDEPVHIPTVCRETPELGEKTVTNNGIYVAEDDGYLGYSQVTVEVPTEMPPDAQGHDF